MLDPSPSNKKTAYGSAKRYFEEVVLNYRGSECLIWPFAAGSTGYGLLRHSGRQRVVSRIVCEIINGPPPMDNSQAAHTCGRGRLGCVAPTHLRWASPSENQHDKIAHGTTRRGTRSPLAKLTEADVLNIRAIGKTLSQTEIASRFGITQTTVSKIILGKKWAWLGEGAGQ